MKKKIYKSTRWSELPVDLRDTLDKTIRIYSSKNVTERGCIIWKAGTSNGRIPSVGCGKDWIVYKVSVPAYLLERKLGRALREGHRALHTCDNVDGPCVNIDHIYEGTMKKNMLDMLERNRKTNIKLTTEQVLEIYRLTTAENKDPNRLAIRYNVSPSLIRLIRDKKRWIHLLESQSIDTGVSA